MVARGLIGKVRVAVVPCFGAEAKSKRPFKAFIRSRIVRRPIFEERTLLRAGRRWPLRGREIEAALITHHDLKEALVAGQADGRLFYGRMLRRVDQQFPHRAKEQDGATERNGALIYLINPLLPLARDASSVSRALESPRPVLVRAG